MIFGRIPAHATSDQLSSSIQRALAGIMGGWIVEHKPTGKHEFPAGTWTPHDLSGAGLQLTASSATWVRLGQIVVLTFRIVYPATADGSTATIGGLPYTCTLDPDQNSVWAQNLAFTTDATNALTIFAGTNTKTLFVSNLAGTGATNANLSTDTIAGTLFYRTSET